MRRRDLVALAPAFLASPLLGQGGPAAAIVDYEAASGGHIGLYARNLRTGTELAWRADERFVMCSTFKASLAALVLLRVDRGRDRLDAQVRFSPSDVPDWWAPVAKANLARGTMSLEEMCAAAVEQSDNSCANLLLAPIGGPAALTAFWRAIGDRETRLDDNEPELNRTPPGGLRNTTTPAAMANILREIVLGHRLSGSSRAKLTRWLLGCQTGANRLRGGLPKNWVIGDKTGNNGADGAGDIAIAWPDPRTPIVIAAYTRGGSPTPAQLETVFAKIGRLVAARLA